MCTTARAARLSTERSAGSSAARWPSTTRATTRSSSVRWSRWSSEQPPRRSSTWGARSRRWSALRFPVAVERALHLDEPDDVADEREQEPQTVDPAHGALLAVEVLVHVTHLRRHEEERDRRDQDVDDQPDHSADTVAGVALDLLLRLVRPNERVDAER